MSSGVLGESSFFQAIHPSKCVDLVVVIGCVVCAVIAGLSNGAAAIGCGVGAGVLGIYEILRIVFIHMKKRSSEPKKIENNESVSSSTQGAKTETCKVDESQKKPKLTSDDKKVWRGQDASKYLINNQHGHVRANVNTLAVGDLVAIRSSGICGGAPTIVQIDAIEPIDEKGKMTTFVGSHRIRIRLRWGDDDQDRFRSYVIFAEWQHGNPIPIYSDSTQALYILDEEALLSDTATI